MTLLALICICMYIIYLHMHINISTVHGRRVEPYMDKTLATKEYLEYITTPTTAYGNPKEDIGSRYFTEFGDKAIKGHLDKNVYNQAFDMSGFVEVEKARIAMDAETKTAAVIEKVMNRMLEADDPYLFSAVKTRVDRVWEGGTVFVADSVVLLHRIGKMYGILLKARTYHGMAGTYDADGAGLISYELAGFVYEDRVYGEALPSNLFTEKQAPTSTPMDKIIMSKEYEQAAVCKYLEDLKKYRGIDYSLSAEKMACGA